jgi:DNA-binding MarR family transcriptional regulator
MARAQRTLGQRIFDGVMARGFSDQRFAHGHVMAPLNWKDGQRLTDLAEGAAMAPQSMNELVDDLVTKGYVERRPDPADRRAKLIYLTDRGRACAEAGWQAAEESERHLDALLGATGKKRLRTSLRRILGEL